MSAMQAAAQESSGVLPPETTRRLVVEHRLLRCCIIAGWVLFAITAFLPTLDPATDLALFVHLGGAVVWAALAIQALIAVFVLARRLGGADLANSLTFLALIPPVGLLVVFGLDQIARKALKANGAKVRLFS